MKLPTIWLTILLLVGLKTFSQKTNFISDNGFAGTFEMVGGELQEGSAIIERFKTSVSVFYGEELKEHGIVFPLPCSDCGFRIKEQLDSKDGPTYKVEDLNGETFQLIVGAAKEYVQVQQEDKKYRALLASIKSEPSIEGRKRLVYNAYASFYNKERIENLLDSLRAPQHSISDVKQPVERTAKAQAPIADRSISDPVVRQRPKTVPRQQEIAQQVGESKYSDRPNESRYQQKIKKRETKKTKVKNNDERIVMAEIDRSNARLRKREMKEVAKNKKTGTLNKAEVPNGPLTRIDRDSNSEPAKEALPTSLKTAVETVDHAPEEKSVPRNEKGFPNTYGEPGETSELSVGDLQEAYKNCPSRLETLEDKIVAAAKKGDYQEADEVRETLAAERRACKALKKELRKTDKELLVTDNKKRISIAPGRLRQIDSPRISF